MKIGENVVEDESNDGCEQPHKDLLFCADAVDFHFRAVAFVRVPQPRDQREKRHRHCHAEVGDHFAVIRKAKGNNTVE